MARYIPDVKTQRWVVIAPGRTKRPDEVRQKPAVGCVFCPGNEHMTPPEVYRIGGGEKDKRGWQVRVVPNLYPITDIHEVIIHSPDCKNDLEHLPFDQVARVMTAYRDRYRAHDNDGHVLIFCNHGFLAGASLGHPHSQLVVVPRQIQLDTLAREPIHNIVEETKEFSTYCPDFSQWPYEMWIVPKVDGEKFGDISNGTVPLLALGLRRALRRIEGIFTLGQAEGSHSREFYYNYYIYHGDHWYIRIIPRFVHRAGFELGTGLSVNTVDPTQAAEKLKAIVLEDRA